MDLSFNLIPRYGLILPKQQKAASVVRKPIFDEEDNLDEDEEEQLQVRQLQVRTH